MSISPEAYAAIRDKVHGSDPLLVDSSETEQILAPKKLTPDMLPRHINKAALYRPVGATTMNWLGLQGDLEALLPPNAHSSITIRERLGLTVLTQEAAFIIADRRKLPLSEVLDTFEEALARISGPEDDLLAYTTTAHLRSPITLKHNNKTAYLDVGLRFDSSSLDSEALIVGSVVADTFRIKGPICRYHRDSSLLVLSANNQGLHFEEPLAKQVGGVIEQAAPAGSTLTFGPILKMDTTGL